MLLIPILLSAQYWGERVTEKSFEQSDLYFNSHYLNPYGIYQFKDASLGLMNDPFLQTHLNPAYIGDDSVAANRIYIDFRGDRTEASVVSYGYGARPHYLNYIDCCIIDPRWYTITRTEPEPVFSFGYRSRITEKLNFTAGYQFIFRDEKYYQTPSGIYSPMYGYDYGGNRLAESDAVPIVDRAGGEDKMLTRGHLFSASAGYRLFEKLALGVTASAVKHSREGQYGYFRNDEYSSTSEDEWSSNNLKSKNQDYKHIEISSGLRWYFSEKLDIGLKVSLLDGTADQDYSQGDSSVYRRYVNNNYENFNLNSTKQTWEHDGTSKQGIFTLNYKMSPSRGIHIFARYGKKLVDLINSSVINDTSHYQGEYSYSGSSSNYNSWSYLKDNRTGTGETEQEIQEVMVSFRWWETAKTKVNLGLYFSNNYFTTNTSEPVIFSSESYYYRWRHYPPEDPYEYTRYGSRYENKRLAWKMETTKQTMQIPILIERHFSKNWSFFVLANKIWDYWRIEDVTTAYFTVRRTNENGVQSEEENFGERYSQPVKSISEDRLDIMGGLTLNLSENLKVSMIADPEINPHWHMAQWWLKFQFRL